MMQAVLLVTFHGNDRYLRPCVDVIDRLWPDHPELWILTDHSRQQIPNLVMTHQATWVQVVLTGLELLLAHQVLSQSGYVVLLIEDHAPVQPVPGDTLTALTRYASENSMRFVSLHGHGRGDEYGRLGDVIVCRTRDDFVYYSELHPAIWRVEHLRAMCVAAIQMNCLDPWCFEKMRLPEIPHYTSTLRWPSPFGGFLNGGRVNAKAIREMNVPEVQKLRRLLAFHWLLGLPKSYWQRARGRIHSLMQ